MSDPLSPSTEDNHLPWATLDMLQDFPAQQGARPFGLPFQARASLHARRTSMFMERPRGGRWRIALYSHDTMGLGHVRRNLLVAQALANSDLPVDILLIMGKREGSGFLLPPHVDCLTLPALHKSTDGTYSTARLGLDLREMIQVRSQVIHASLQAFQPDLLIVDNVPRGAVRELDAALHMVRRHGHTRCVLGLRDVLDDPNTVRREWQNADNIEVLRKYYDEVWIYGDPRVYDPVRRYRFAPDIAAKVRYTGYLDQRARLHNQDPLQAPAARPPLPGPFVLCSVGGGQDGARLAEAFVQACLPAHMHGVLLTGPFLPEETQRRVRHYALHHPRMSVLGHLNEPAPLLLAAERIVAMGGYNTVAEILSYEKHALVVPRVKPRHEQLIRVERLRDLGLVHMLHPTQISPEAIGDWLAHDLGTPPKVHDKINMRGLEHLPHLVENILSSGLEEQSRFVAEGALDRVA